MIHEKVREARKAKGMTQAQLALLAGVRRGTISSFESGSQSIRTDTLEKLLKILDIEI